MEQDKKHFELLGEVASNFNLLEMTIKSFVVALINDKDPFKGFLIINDYQFSKLLLTFKILFEHSINDKKALSAFKKVHKRCVKISTTRNTLLHSAYVPYQSNGKNHVLRLNLKIKNGGVDSKIIELDELDKFNLEMLKCYHNISTIRHHLKTNKILVIDAELDQDIDTYDIDKPI